MDVKKSLMVFFISGVFWFLLFFIFFGTDNPKYLNSQNKVNFDGEKLKKKTDKYTQEQKDFIEIFQSSFEDR